MKTYQEVITRMHECSLQAADPNDVLDIFDEMLAACMTGLLTRADMSADRIMYSAARYAFDLTIVRCNLRVQP